MKYIVDFKPYVDEKNEMNHYADIERRITLGQSITQSEAEDFLAKVSYLTRKKLNPNMDNFDNLCDTAQSILGYYFEDINAKVTHCSTQRVISPKVTGHNFSIVSLNVEGEEKDFLLDPTYIQFFSTETCNESNYMISKRNPNLVLLTPSPGYFINEEDMEPVQFLLKYGYIELTPEYAKIYGDSFYNTDRGIKINPKERKSLPSLMYFRSFKSGREPLSISAVELNKNNQNITIFQSVENTTKKVI